MQSEFKQASFPPLLYLITFHACHSTNYMQERHDRNKSTFDQAWPLRLALITDISFDFSLVFTSVIHQPITCSNDKIEINQHLIRDGLARAFDSTSR